MQKFSNLILVINCGSSSLKFSIFSITSNSFISNGYINNIGLDKSNIFIKYRNLMNKNIFFIKKFNNHNNAIKFLFKELNNKGLLDLILAIGHRVVHGGEIFTKSILINKKIIMDIEDISDLAPLHNTVNLLGIYACLKELPKIPQIAVFDTSFHQTIIDSVFTYAIPQYFYKKYNIRRYGFHGISYRYVSAIAVDKLNLDPHDHCIIIAHLGNGASVTSIMNGSSIDTSMGFTPLEGLVMGTRCGDIDFGVISHIARKENISLKKIEDILNKKSGLIGISGTSSDCRVLEEKAKDGDSYALLALNVFIHRLTRYIGALSTSMPRLDALIFTGGIGENSSYIREITLNKLTIFGFTLNNSNNNKINSGLSGRIDNGTGPLAWVIPTHEENIIIRDVINIIGINI